jgi:hypothetical protein
MAIFGIVSLRAGVFPRSISVTIIVAGIGAGIPIAGAYLYASLVFGFAIGWLGVWLMQPSGVHVATAKAAAAKS